ncbi:hypothetical protein SI65_05668 [Aspergillus cristatus]|uniref:Xylanolytic transcriptional activator regulatory domain-containing protein n=1 Tax=Aspergillus cristatus TaxID=573508 RepID=A0A1E3BE64_ASPCR|nr:hypothetical protein SI65_05668 [Aspergillus cristatus]
MNGFLMRPQAQDGTDPVADPPPQVLGDNCIMDNTDLAPDTGSSAQSNPALPVTPFIFGSSTGDISNLGSMQLNGDGLNELDLLDENSSLAFHDFVPSQFLDTDISLSELLHQSYMPAHLNFMVPEFPAALAESQSPQARPHSPTIHPGQDLNSAASPPPKIPSIDNQHTSHSDLADDTTDKPWAVSTSAYQAISNKLLHSKPILSTLTEFSLPSRYTLARYLEGYFGGFHHHLPFLHLPSFDPGKVELELLFALAALGALYRFEKARAYQMYGVCRSLIDERMKIHRQQTIAQVTALAATDTVRSAAHSPYYARTPQHAIASVAVSEAPYPTLQQVQAMIILMAMTAWCEEPLVRESLAMSSHVAVFVRCLGIHQDDTIIGQEMEWSAWVAHEELRRTLLAAYVCFNLQSITFNIPPMILSQEVAICLPSCEAEWNAPSSATWQRHRAQSRLRERSFTTTLDQLLMGQSISDKGAVSGFSNYALIHGIVQKIFLDRQAAGYHVQGLSQTWSMSLKSTEKALGAWQRSWEATTESTLNPSSPKGPLGFSATALLRLAHIRLNANLGACRDLISGDPERIRQACTNTQLCPLIRSPSLDRAILQCIHALSIPIRIGIPYVARTQTLHWSTEHSICYLECAFLLTRWMQEAAEAVRVGGMAALRDDEQKLLAMMRNLVGENNLKVVDSNEDPAMQICRLAAAMARLWADISSGIHVFHFEHRVGMSLSAIADLLESELSPS